jgi:hypothetical protein
MSRCVENLPFDLPRMTIYKAWVDRIVARDGVQKGLAIPA